MPAKSKQEPGRPEQLPTRPGQAPRILGGSPGSMRWFAEPKWQRLLHGPLSWPTGAYLLRQGSLPGTLYAVEEGTLNVVHVWEDGTDDVIEIAHGPTLIGVAFAICSRPSSVDVIAATPCSLHSFSAPEFMSTIEAGPPFLAEAFRWQCVRVLDLYDRCIEMSQRSSEQRLRNFLERYARADAGGVRGGRHQLPFRHSLVASYIGVTPEHLSRLLTKMTKASLVTGSRSLLSHGDCESS